MSAHVLAALAWDPQIRGALIVLTAFAILPGSVYLLLATNTGAKLGFLLAAAGFTGWMAVMGWVWVAYGIGIKGDPPTWHVQEVVTGSVSDNGTTKEATNFPSGWIELKPGAPILGDASAAADKVLAPVDATPKHGEKKKETVPVNPVFDNLQDYAFVRGYTKGGENYWIPGGGLSTETRVGNPGSNPFAKIANRLGRGPLHSPHYAVVQVGPVIPVPDIGGAPPKPTPDPTKPTVSVVMVRDQGSLRFPSTMVAISMSIVFVMVVNALHRRDKEVMARRAEPATA